MIWRDMPPLAALRAFSAYAETGSLQAAGDALNVTHAAISQHIRKLEAHLGVPLLDRAGRKAALTGEGKVLAKAILDGMEGIASAVGEITGVNEARPLVVSTTPSFAANWLVPRLADFRARHPDIDVIIDANAALVDFSKGQVDVAFRFGKGGWLGVQSELLVPTQRVAVATPDFLKTGRPATPAELANYPVLQETGTSESTDWLARHGVPDAGKGGKIALPGITTLDAVRAGQGILVTACVWVQADLEAGRLERLFTDAEDLGYFTVTKPGVPRKALKAFLKWLPKTL